MKKIILATAFIGLLTGLQSCKTQKKVVNREVQTSNGTPMLLGIQTTDQLKKEPYIKWYQENYDEYTVDEETITALKKKHLNRYKITVFLGTWCGDSKREVPRLMKILDALNYPKEKLTLIGVNRRKESPGGRATLNVIRKVPTIIVKKYGKEFGRIIETPNSGYIEKDLLEILNKDNQSVIKDLLNK